MAHLDLGTLLLPTALIVAPLALRTFGVWSWTAWLPPRLRAIENRRALAFLRMLVMTIRDERHPPGGHQRATDEQPLAERFVEVADALARLMPGIGGAEGGISDRPVSDRLRSLAAATLGEVLEPTENTTEHGRRRHLARACLEILRKLPSPSNAEVLRRALSSADAEVAQLATSVVAAAPQALRDAIAPPEAHGGDGDLKIYRTQLG